MQQSVDSARAAQYLRMSTDMQQYSLDNQSDAIAAYAQCHGYIVVRSYEDGAKSGLQMAGRAALANLIKDVVSGGAEFKTLLVYDVSRWTFLFPLFKHAEIEAYLETEWPGFILQMKEAFIAVVVEGPFPHGISGFRGRRREADYSPGGQESVALARQSV